MKTSKHSMFSGGFLALAITFCPAFAASARADEIKVLHRGDQSLSAFYQAIAGANKTIDLATFLIEPCQAAPKLLLNTIVKKAKLGVKVRIVLEAYMFKEPHKSGLPAWLESQSKNIELRRYGGSSIFGIDRPRSHTKSLVVDGETYIVGGRNLTDEYFGLSSKLNYLDQDLLIRGGSAKIAGGYFNELWLASAKASASGDGNAYAASCITKNSRDQALTKFIIEQGASLLSERPSHSCNSIDYQVDHPKFMDNTCGTDSGPDSDFLGGGVCYTNKRTTGLYISFMEGTRRKLAINNQYYFPWGRVRKQLDRLRDEKKVVEVYSNATGDIEDRPSHNAAFTCYIQSSAFQTYKGTQKVGLLTSVGALRDAWSLTPGTSPWRIHTKTAIRDEEDVFVGSWNIDPRSYQTNLESGVVIEGCKSLATDLNAQYEQLRATLVADKECAPCKAQYNKTYMSGSASCGGTPTFY